MGKEPAIPLLDVHAQTVPEFAPSEAVELVDAPWIGLQTTLQRISYGVEHC
jgi:hypothetical protein